MRFIKLQEGDSAVLEQHIAHSPNATFRKRCQAILMSSKGIEVSVIALTFSTRTRTIYSWFNLYERCGISCLRNKAGQGRKPKLSASNLDQVHQAVKQDRQQLKTGLIYLKEEELAVSKKTLKRFLKKMASDTADSEGV